MNPYEILGVSQSATKEEIEKAYKKLARKYHPDKNIGDPEAEKKFKEIQSAYDLITKGTPNQDAGFDPFSFFFSQDIFTQRERRGQSLKIQCSLEFMESILGGTKTITLTEKEPCTSCKGSGGDQSSRIQCEACHGNGKTSYNHGNVHIMNSCRMCQGIGFVYYKKCKDCESGYKKLKREVQFDFPAGCEDGDNFVIHGAGEQVPDGKNGDLYVIVYVKPDKIFRRDHKNLIVEVPILPSVAYIGGEIEVPLIKGTKTIAVPPLSTTGSKITVKKEGINFVGDLIVELKIVSSDKDDEELKKLYSEILKLEESSEINKFKEEIAKR